MRRGRALPEGTDKIREVRAMFDTIAPRYELVNKIITLGMDGRWRRATVSALSLAKGSVVLDVGCGTGDMCRELADGRYRAIGIDMSRGMLKHARSVPAPLVEGDALCMPFPSSSFDGVVSGFALRNVESLSTLFAELGRIVRGGGRVALLEVATPTLPVVRSGHALYFGKIVPRIGALLSDPAAYRYLPESVSYMPEPDVLQKWLAAAGFGAIRRRMLSGGLVQLWTATLG